MSNNLVNTALSGLNAAQIGLSTAANNLSNVAVAGYHRQTAILTQNGGTGTMQGFIGNGVSVTTVNREYNSFITKQLRSAQSQQSAQNAYLDQISQIDNLLSNSTNNLSVGMEDFFKNLQNLVNDASNDAARQSIIGKAEGLVSQFKTADKYLQDLGAGVNQQLSDSVVQINNYSKQIAKLNDQITQMRASGGGHEPNALLDQRDQLVSELNKIVGVQVTQQDGDAYNITFANGLSLVQGSQAYEVQAVPSAQDPTRLAIAYNSGTGAHEIPEAQIDSGSVHGLLDFRSGALTDAQNQLGRLALALADNFNQQHKEGFDLKGQAGTDFFSFAGGRVVGNANNTGNASLTVSYDKSDEVKASDYRVDFDGQTWQVTRLSDNAKIPVTPETDDEGNVSLKFDGLNINVAGTANANDSFVIKPVSDVVGSLKVEITDASKIAAAGSATAGPGDNENAKKLLELQSKKLVEGTLTLGGAYAGLVSDVGSATATAKVNSTSQGNIVKQLTEEQQSISGVNMDEEYANLLNFQQYYMANAQIIQTDNTIFNALLNSL